MSRVVIIGAGPIGLEAALLARQSGHDVKVVEKGLVASNVRDWGHVRLFTPFAMNSSVQGRGAVVNAFGAESLPRDDELLTGIEFADRYLTPLSRVPELSGCVYEQHEVHSISRQRFLKTDGIGQQKRASDPFQLLLQTNDERQMQSLIQADIVLDCSGTYPHHNWIGPGGLRLPYEQQQLKDLDYCIRPITADHFANQTTLVIGAGYSAATAIIALQELATAFPQSKTKVIWLTRPLPDGSDRPTPIQRIPNDPLHERDRVAQRANELALSTRSAITWKRDAQVVGFGVPDVCRYKIIIEQRELTTSLGQGSESLLRVELNVDRIVANVGYRPNRSLYEELQIHECYATQGPIKLAAKLLGETSSDCLAQTSHGCEVLKNPESNFFILGSKSYGRNSNFLLKIGLEQVREVVASLNPLTLLNCLRGVEAARADQPKDMGRSG